MAEYPEGAIFFTDSKERAKIYGNRIVEVYLNIEDAILVNVDVGTPESYIDNNYKPYADYFNEGRDGIIVNGFDPKAFKDTSVYVVFDPNQIHIINPPTNKSAIDTILTKAGFDPNQERGEDGTWGSGGSTKLEDKPCFKEWFGDSKVVDKDGKPKPVYHGTPDKRGIEEDGVFKSILGNNAFFFSDKYSVAESYADDTRSYDYQNAEPKVYTTYLSIKKPLEINAMGAIWRKFETEIGGEKIRGTRNIVKYAQNNGYDGLIVKNVRDNYTGNTSKTPKSTIYTTFKPNQIKLSSAESFCHESNINKSLKIN